MSKRPVQAQPFPVRATVTIAAIAFLFNSWMMPWTTSLVGFLALAWAFFTYPLVLAFAAFAGFYVQLMRRPSLPAQLGIVAIVLAAFSLPLVVATFSYNVASIADFLQLDLLPYVWPTVLQYSLVPTGLFTLTLLVGMIWSRKKLDPDSPASEPALSSPPDTERMPADIRSVGVTVPEPPE